MEDVKSEPTHKAEKQVNKPARPRNLQTKADELYDQLTKEL